ncbi:hypothetical protein [uncultured Jatrophihabitans sp.]|uniref:hypothetical protein n=1 Tax=uncultured Jatrophihabitans sp. TaxID=1610747 RepID=UPI0035CC68D2
MAEFYRDEDDRPAPYTVVAAVALGTVPVPFLAVYAVLFIVHGSVHPVIPPDITGSTHGELLAGIIAAVLFVACSVSLIWAIAGRRRWPFALVQVVLFAAAVYFLVDGDKGGTFVSWLVVLSCLAALVLIFVPASWRHYDAGTVPWLRGRRRTAGAHAQPGTAPDGAVPAGSTAPVPEPVPSRSWLSGRASQDPPG